MRKGEADEEASDKPRPEPVIDEDVDKSDDSEPEMCERLARLHKFWSYGLPSTLLSSFKLDE
jgi:hypothetical protein